MPLPHHSLIVRWLCLFACWSAGITIPCLADTLTDQVGVLSAMDFGAIPDDDGDDTAALQTAINAALAKDMTLYVPPGVYLVSNTLEAKVQGRGNCGGEEARAFRLVGHSAPSLSGPRTVFRLRDNLPAFNNPHHATGDDRLKSVLWVWLHAPAFTRGSKENCLFHCTVRDLDIDLGTGNSFAVGIDYGAAQFSTVQNVSIKATGAFAGFTAIPGRSMANVNLAVEGGRYGFYLNGRSVGSALYGINLTNQTEAGIYSAIYRGFTVVGMDFSTDASSASAIRLGGTNVSQGHLVLTDARLRLPPNTTVPAIDNPAARHVSLIDTYVTGAKEIVAGAGMPTTHHLCNETPARWTHVADYAFTPGNAGSAGEHLFPGKHVINGKALTDGENQAPATLRQTSLADAPPTNLINRHVWSSTPSFTDPDVLVLTPTGKDDTAAIQNALVRAAHPDTAFSKVLLTPGNYTINAPIMIPAGTVLMGIPGYRVIIRPSAGFVKRFTSVKGSTPRGWMFVTPDEADADPVIMDLSIFPPKTADSGLGVIHWRSGRGEVRGIKPSDGGYEESHRRMVQIDGHGGGRWYGYCDHFAVPPNGQIDRNFRKLFIGPGKGNPLTFYGLNLERGGRPSNRPQSPFCEINDARNIRIFSVKTETDDLVFDIRNGSRNIQIASIQPTLRDENPDRHLIRIDLGDCPSEEAGIDLRNVLEPLSAAAIIEDYFPNEAPGGAATRNDYLGVYRRGVFSTAPWRAAEGGVSIP